MTTYEVLGTTSDHTDCELCGRADLKGTVALKDEDGNVVYFGTDCAARALGWTQRDVKAAAKTQDDERRATEAAARRAAADAETERYVAFLIAETGVARTPDVIPTAQDILGGFAAARRLYNERTA